MNHNAQPAPSHAFGTRGLDNRGRFAREGAGVAFGDLDMSICPHCGGHTPTPRHSEKLRELFAARVGMPARVNRRNPDAAHNEMATDIVAAAIDGDARAIRTVVRHAEDFIDPSRACPEPRRAVGFIEVKPGEETERFDEFTGPMGGGL